jgi:hypothetical protein
VSESESVQECVIEIYIEYDEVCDCVRVLSYECATL